MENEIVKTEKNNHPAQVTPTSVLAQAYEKGESIDTLTKLLELQERYERRESEKAFNLALASFKANPPKILKDKHVSFDTSKGKTEYSHASLANVVYTISESLSNYGLCASWETNQDSGQISVTCILSHELGYKVKTTLSALSDQSGGKNSIQAIGSTVSYLQRYTLLSITGLATHDQDDDANNIEIRYLSDEQVANIESLAQEVGGDIQKLCKYFNASSIDKIQSQYYEKVIKVIESKRAKK